MKSLSTTFHQKVIEQYFPVVLLIMLYKMVLTFESVYGTRTTIHLQATEQYFPVVLFIMLYKMVLTFESVYGTLQYHYSP